MSDTRAQAKEQLSALIQRVMEDGKIEPGEREELQAVYRQAILTVSDVREVLGRYIKSVQDEVLADVERNRPALVILESGTWLDAIDKIPNPRRIPRVWAWVDENYPMRVKVGSSTVALPRAATN